MIFSPFFYYDDVNVQRFSKLKLYIFCWNMIFSPEKFSAQKGRM